MSSPYTQSLFSERSDSGHHTTPIAASAVLHVLLIAAVWFTVAYRPPFVRLNAEHYKVRELDLSIPDEARTPPKIRYPASTPGAHASASAGKPSQTPPALQEVAQAKPGPQTLIQPDVQNPVTLAQQIPVPQVVIWKPSSVPVRKITPPPPQPPVSAEAKPSVELPNDEQTLSDVNLASTLHLTPKPSPDREHNFSCHRARSAAAAEGADDCLPFLSPTHSSCNSFAVQPAHEGRRCHPTASE